MYIKIKDDLNHFVDKLLKEENDQPSPDTGEYIRFVLEHQGKVVEVSRENYERESYDGSFFESGSEWNLYAHMVDYIATKEEHPEHWL